MRSSLFIDTSALYALEDADDRHHEEARTIQARCRQERVDFLTTHHVLDESITLIGAKLAPAQAVRFARRLLSSHVVRIVRTDDEIERAALNLYERYQDSRLSFTDCLSFSVMHSLGITTAFAFDRHFVRAGFQVLREASH